MSKGKEAVKKAEKAQEAQRYSQTDRSSRREESHVPMREKQQETDEKDLMPYHILVEIERLAIRDRQSPKQVFENLKSHHDEASIKLYVKKFFRLWAINQWKRERLAPSFHVDDLNVDPRSWCRFPILSGGFEKELEEL